MQRSVPIGTAALFFLILILGGGGTHAPIFEALVETAAMLWLLGLLYIYTFDQLRPPAGFIWAALFFAILPLIALLQMIPLPYSLWSSLPGRELAVRAVELAGLGQISLPLSLDVQATRAAGLSLIPAAAIFFGAAPLGHGGRMLLVKVVVVIAAISAVLAAFQFAMPGNENLYIFPNAAFTNISGILANRNFHADLLLIGILFCALLGGSETGHLNLGSLRKPRTVHLSLILIPFLALMVIATQSRFGVLMLGPVLLISYLIASKGHLSRSIPIALGLLIAAGAALAVVAPDLMAAVSARLWAQDSRIGNLPDILYLIGLYFPVGAGLGTFDPVFRSAESLTLVGPRYLNQAHNDYLETLIETGIVGPALAAIFLLAFLWRCWKLRRSDAPSATLLVQRTAAIAIILLLLHSAIEYPLRSLALQSLFAFLCVLLFTRPPVQPAVDGRPD